MARKKRKSQFHQLASHQLLTGETHTANPEAVRLFLHYKNLALNLYRWENLPPRLESRHIEEALFNHGQVYFMDDEDYGLICLPCAESGGRNIYNDPLHFRVFGGNGFNRHVNVDKGIRILNNDSATPSIIHINHYAERMANIDSIIQQNLNQQRFPFMVGTSKATEFSVKNMMNDVLDGELAIFKDDTLWENGKPNVEVFNFNVPYLVDKLTIELHDLERQLLTHLGLNSTIEKKERLLVDETNANNSHIEMNLDLGFKARQLACQQINERFGLNIQVHRSMELIEPLYGKRGEDNGEV